MVVHRLDEPLERAFFAQLCTTWLQSSITFDKFKHTRHKKFSKAMVAVFDWEDMVPIKFNYSEKVSTFDYPKVKFWLLIKKLLRASAFEP